jgi:alpha-beta hydrolase superfamily lysophospholipase
VRRRQPAHLLEIDGVDVDVAIYKDARHALLNETNQDQVTTDIIGWLLLHGYARADEQAVVARIRSAKTAFT